MADNIELNSGSGGATLATDDVAGVHYQIVKIGTGALDAAGTPVSDANPLPIDDAGGSITVDNAGTFAVQVDGAALTALQLIDDAVYTDATGTPSKGLAVMGTDGTNPQLIAVDSSGNVQVDLVTANVTNAGTFAVQVDSCALPTGAATAGNQSTIIGHVDGIEALLTTIDADTGALAATVSGGSILVDLGANNDVTVTGTVTANLSATDNAVLDVIETNTSGNTSHYRNIDANAEAEIKGSAGTLKWLHAMNLTAAKAYLHLYDNVAASVTPGTTTPTYTFPIATTGDTNGAGFVLPAQIEFSTGITLVVTTTLDGSAGDPGTNGVIVNAGYV